MQKPNKTPNRPLTLNVSHDLQRRLLEMLSLIRVLNNYYHKKSIIEQQLKPLVLRQFKEGLKTITKSVDWLFSVPSALSTLSEDFLSKKDSFRFPDSIILFETWMNLGLKALYPRIVLHFKFPGFLKGEKVRNVLQFIYSISRGFGFPIYFGPSFYEYFLTYGKILEPLFRWGHTVCHKANQAINLVENKFKIKRHHPGEFESIIISEYSNNVFKGIDTLLHGYFTNDPKYLGRFSSFEEALCSVSFSYTIGDHAMSVNVKKPGPTLQVPLISYDQIVEKYDVDFYSYIKDLIKINRLLVTKIAYYKKARKLLIKKLKFSEKVKVFLEKSKIFSFRKQNLSSKYSEVERYAHNKHLMEKIKELLWTTPPYTHTIHKPTIIEKYLKLELDGSEQESIDSIILSYINFYEKEQKFIFEENKIIEELKVLRDKMAKMWLYFKERHFKYAVKKIDEISSFSLDDKNYLAKVNEYVQKLIPIISIYEIFHRPLSESVYPESISQTKRLGAYLAKFLTSKYNLLGMNVINLFNRLAFYNWSYFIVKKKLNQLEFFRFILKLPIWRHIPFKVKKSILDNT